MGDVVSTLGILGAASLGGASTVSLESVATSDAALLFESGAVSADDATLGSGGDLSLQKALSPFVSREGALAAARIALGASSPLSSATMKREGFQLLEGLKPPLTQGEIEELLAFFLRFGERQEVILTPDNWPFKNILIFDETDKNRFLFLLSKVRDYVVPLESKVRSVLTGESFYFNKIVFRWTDGLSGVCESYTQPNHHDTWYATVSVAFSGKGTVIHQEGRDLTVPPGIPVLFTGLRRSNKQHIPPTFHRAPELKEGERRLVLFLIFEENKPF